MKLLSDPLNILDRHETWNTLNSIWLKSSLLLLNLVESFKFVSPMITPRMTLLGVVG